MSRPDPQASPEATGPAEAPRPRRRNPFEGLLPLLTTGLVVLGGGFYWGWTTRANLKPSLEQLRAQEQDQLLALGWKQSADGVLTTFTQLPIPACRYGHGSSLCIRSSINVSFCANHHVYGRR